MFLRSAYAVLRQAKAGTPVAQSVAAASKVQANPQLVALAATQVQVRCVAHSHGRAQTFNSLGYQGRTTVFFFSSY